MKSIPNALTIAGVDPSGGAGIYADLKAFSALGAYGMGVVAALTAQNTQGVEGVQSVPLEFIAKQIDMIYADVRVDAVKIGMLADIPTIEAVADSLIRNGEKNIVVDPVMVAKGGHRLLRDEAIDTLKKRILPIARILTPNIPEASELLDGREINSVEDMKRAAHDLRAMGPQIIVLKGGHLEGAESIDVVDDGDEQVIMTAKRISTKNTHGTGCTLSAAIAALLPQHGKAIDAIRAAKVYIAEAIRRSDELDVGHGHGPVHHFHALWKGRHI